MVTKKNEKSGLVRRRDRHQFYHVFRVFLSENIDGHIMGDDAAAVSRF